MAKYTNQSKMPLGKDRIIFNVIEALGFLVYCIDRPEQIGRILNEIQTA